MFDASEVFAYAAHLVSAAEQTDDVARDWQSEHGGKWAKSMSQIVPRGPGDPVHLADEIHQVEPGGITFGRADHWVFVQYGTVHMAPQDFIGRARRRIQPEAVKDAEKKALRLIQRGR